jgi:hypothetical protein
LEIMLKKKERMIREEIIMITMLLLILAHKFDSKIGISRGACNDLFHYYVSFIVQWNGRYSAD